MAGNTTGISLSPCYNDLHFGSFRLCPLHEEQQGPIYWLPSAPFPDLLEKWRGIREIDQEDKPGEHRRGDCADG